MADSFFGALPLRPKGGHSPNADNSSGPKKSRADVRKIEKLCEIEKNWANPETGEPFRGFLPEEIRPRALVNGYRAVIGNDEARILENEEWSSNLVDALWNLSFRSKGDLIGAQKRLSQAVSDRHKFGAKLPNQFVVEILPNDVWNLVAKSGRTS